MDLRSISHYLGIFLLVSGCLYIFPTSVSLLYNEPPWPFMITGGMSIFLGLIFTRFPKKALDFGDAMLLVAITLLVISFFGAIPFFMRLEGNPTNVLINGYFESVSGYSTTGLTILPEKLLDPDSINYSHSLIFSRTLQEWIGGLGIIILTLSILARGGISTVYLYKMSWGSERITPSVERTARIIFRVYLFYTLSLATFLWIIGVDGFHAITSVMSTISTGGFISNDQGLNPGWIGNSILMISMLAGAIPFTLHYLLFGGNLSGFFRNIEIRALAWFLSIFLLGFILLSVNSGIYKSGISAVYHSAIGTISVLTTTGYSSGGLEQIGNTGKFLLVILMVVGAGSGSSGGGLKLIRVSVLIKAIQWLIRKSSLPDTAILPLKVGKKIFSDKELRTISLFFFIYIILIGMGMLILLFFGVGNNGQEIQPMDALLLSSSALGTNGITTVNVASQGIIVKLFLIFLMIAGRLEIFPVLALIGYIYRNIMREVEVVEEEAIEIEHEVIYDIEEDVKIAEEKIGGLIKKLTGKKQ